MRIHHTHSIGRPLKSPCSHGAGGVARTGVQTTSRRKRNPGARNQGYVTAAVRARKATADRRRNQRGSAMLQGVDGTVDRGGMGNVINAPARAPSAPEILRLSAQRHAGERGAQREEPRAVAGRRTNGECEDGRTPRGYPRACETLRAS
ncbi:MAG: hypothetical protein G01um1014106_505 [Parcubacteria group bacterium Gr01-1014_106]|nr:MAG: hypothetical protein G01um1014106_505 [Parcubacteria group bacterium Gr01-1014_106]